jgi:hypothetical protein
MHLVRPVWWCPFKAVVVAASNACARGVMCGRMGGLRGASLLKRAFHPWRCCRRELVLMVADDRTLPFALNTIMNLADHNMAHYLLITTTQALCNKVHALARQVLARLPSPPNRPTFPLACSGFGRLLFRRG